MKIQCLILISLATAMFVSCTNAKSEKNSEESTKDVLLAQLKKTHNNKEWFVPINVALEGVTAEQAMWHEASGNHSIGQLAYHLLFWNKRQLAKFKGQPEGDLPNSNDETFSAFSKVQWEQTMASLDSVMVALENEIASSDEKKLKEWYSTIANISVHNAYHTGQIVFVRKLQQTWDPAKGVR